MTRAQVFASGSALLLCCLGLIAILSPHLVTSSYIPLAENVYTGVVVYEEKKERFKPLFIILAANPADKNVAVELPDGSREMKERASLIQCRNLYIWSRAPALRGVKK